MMSCHQYDYIEIACLYHLPVLLVLSNGESIQGVAQDTLRNAAGQECLLLSVDHAKQTVVLDMIKTMQAQIKNPHFDQIEFD